MRLALAGTLLALGLTACASTEDQKAPPRYTASLQPQSSGVEASLRGLHAVSADVAWASGSGGTYLRTTDGGETWTHGIVVGAEELDFRDVHGFDESSALLLSAGEPARLYRTEDGGESWTLVYENEATGVFFDAMGFWSPSNGMAFSDPIEDALLVISTSDGGRTWRPVSPERLPKTRAGEAGFAASGTCLTVQGEQSVWIGTGGTVARVFRSRDRGLTWSVFDTPLGQARASAGIFSLAFLDEMRGVAVGGDYLNPERTQQNVAVTDDGGESWDLIVGSPPGGYRSAVATVPQAMGVLLAVGRTGGDITSDGGRTWEPFTEEGFYTVSLAPEARVGWVAGSDGRISRVEVQPVRP